MRGKKDYTPQADIDKRGIQFVDAAITAQRWEKYEIDPDIRIDYDIEPRKNDAITGVRVAVQQKAKSRVSVSAKGAKCDGVETEHVAYWVDLHKRPVFLFLVDVTTKKGWWLFIQKYILEELPDDKKHWRTKKTMTVHIPVHQTFDDFKSLEAAMIESYRYMAKLFPHSIEDAISGQKSKLESIDPNFKISVNATELGVNFVLTPKDAPVPISMEIKGKKKRREQIAKDLIGRGVPVDVAPGEIEFHGSPLFSSEEMGKIVKLQFATSSTRDVHLVMRPGQGQEPAELTFSKAKFEGGIEEVRLNGGIFNGLAKIHGVWMRRKTQQRVGLSVDLSKWCSLPAKDLPYHRSISAFIKGVLEEQQLDVFVQHFDSRVYVGSTPSLKKRSRSGWKRMLMVLDWIEKIQLLSNRLNADFTIPAQIAQSDFDSVDEVIRVTTYETWPAPYVTATTHLIDIPSNGLEAMKEGTNPTNGTLTLRKEATALTLLGADIVVPAHKYLLNHMVADVVENTGPNSAKVEWSGSKDTTITVSPDSEEGINKK